MPTIKIAEPKKQWEEELENNENLVRETPDGRIVVYHESELKDWKAFIQEKILEAYKRGHDDSERDILKEKI